MTLSAYLEVMALLYSFVLPKIKLLGLKEKEHFCRLADFFLLFLDCVVVTYFYKLYLILISKISVK